MGCEALKVRRLEKALTLHDPQNAARAQSEKKVHCTRHIAQW